MSRPLDAAQLKLWINHISAGQSQPITKPEIWSVCGAFKMYNVAGALRKCTDGERHSILMFLFGVDSTKTLTRGQYTALMRWLKPTEDESIIPLEMAALLNARAAEQGQLSLFADTTIEMETV